MALIRRDLAAIVAGNVGRHILSVDVPDWYDDALCAQTDPESFYPEKGGSLGPAKKVCAACPVREACLEYALANREREGVWGGLGPVERRSYLRRSA